MHRGAFYQFPFRWIYYYATSVQWVVVKKINNKRYFWLKTKFRNIVMILNIDKITCKGQIFALFDTLYPLYTQKTTDTNCTVVARRYLFGCIFLQMHTNPKPIELLESMFLWQIEPWFVSTFNTVYGWLDSKTLASL